MTDLGIVSLLVAFGGIAIVAAQTFIGDGIALSRSGTEAGHSHGVLHTWRHRDV